MKNDFPMTSAVRLLRAHKVSFQTHLYDYIERGGTKRSSAELGVSEHLVIKTLVMETESRQPLIVLMHGDCEVSTQKLARHLNVKRIEPCDAETAHKLTGYLVGGTSPFGTKKILPIYAERTIFDLDKIYLNGGKRGFLIEISPADLKRVLQLEQVEVRS